MADGKYDLDGKCVVCGKYHPCDCEIANIGDSESDSVEFDCLGED